MTISTILGTGLKVLARAMLCIGVLSPKAFAGPVEDTALAEKEFARGNLIVAMDLWRKAAQQGYAPAQVWLGDILDKAEEDVEAVDWYRKAAEQGSAAGEYGLAQMYLKGEGVKKDFEQARALIVRSAEKDYLPAVMLMMDAYRSGAMGLAVDLVKADEWEAKVKALLPSYQRARPRGPDQAKKPGAK